MIGGESSNPSAARFSQAYDQLLTDNLFNQSAWEIANQTFKASGWNLDRRYNGYGVSIYNPLIRKFYPLLRW